FNIHWRELMAIRIAFVGFRHSHIYDLYSRANASDDFEVVAACEEDDETREQLAETMRARVTHHNFDKMLDEVECDAVAVGDYYGKRGSIIIKALESGKHVISDKPICTNLEELDKINMLSIEKQLKVGCMLDLRDKGQFIRVHDLIRSGEIGEVHSVIIYGQHPLLLGTRPAWYFEEGKHGGTINDIGIHAFDMIPWVTGLEWSQIVAARSWNAFATEVPHFLDAGQFMLKMSNDCGVIGDVSYFMPNSMGYTLDLYWRMTFFGRNGVIETSSNMKSVMLAKDGKNEPEMISPEKDNPGGYLKSFAEEITRGDTEGLSTADVLRASYVALTTQRAGDEELFGIEL
ncbi:MAG: Gfo/Idh/MocA family oxidoreductase, partial [Armatimonadota bacterium]|nr:Gfo/Idh/MocA family oxidoreductase [Armatimonadota bacterium]